MLYNDYEAVVKAKDVIKQKTKIRTEARYFVLKLGLNSTNKEREYEKELVENFIFLNINKRGS